MKRRRQVSRLSRKSHFAEIFDIRRGVFEDLIGSFQELDVFWYFLHCPTVFEQLLKLVQDIGYRFQKAQRAMLRSPDNGTDDDIDSSNLYLVLFDRAGM